MIAGGSRAVGAAVIAILLLTGGAAAQAPSACRMRLAAEGAKFRSLGDVETPQGCGGPDLVLLERVTAADHSEIAIEPPATMRCNFAEAFANFVRDDLAGEAAAMGSTLAVIENYDSYDCRGRNRVAGAQLSEHGRADALDIRALRLRDGRVIAPAHTTAPIAFRRAMKAASCAHFASVLGPGSDGYHEDHIHVDLAQRRSGYSICQWDLHDGGKPDAVAKYGIAGVRSSVPMPRPRPFDAAATGRVAPHFTEGR